ncbi:MAG: 30S ribosomal protein S12 methylthiotransferase RimO [Syntrophobacteraceae bacterium]|nr:30S ribosomal protein S12 methylthiotransferase RimO [Desulfobacteraceae bacterium]
MTQLAAVISLGCAKNLVDSETMVPQITRLGYSMTEDPAGASLILVNTCGFLESAVEEAVETILDAARYKTSGACECLIATGCMVQRYGKKLASLLPEVDLFLGTSHYHELGRILQEHSRGGAKRLWIGTPRHVPTADMPRARSTDFFSAYLKIAEGCSNSCSFCVIPRLRGPYRSRTVEDVVAEAAVLAREGVVEINLIAQDITAFGSDRGAPDALPRLIEALDGVSGLSWVRLLYAYPDRLDDGLLNAMARSSKVVPYLDIPLQHCVPEILTAMRRHAPLRSAEESVDAIRSRIPGIALRTSLMVGFPGESDADFAALCEFVQRTQFDHLGVFAFSPEPGARAARFPRQVDPAVKEERRDILLEIQRKNSRSRLERMVGKTYPVLIEGTHPETDLLLAGRLAVQAPEVDGSVIVTSGTCQPGQIVSAHITASHDYDLEAEIPLP